MCTVPLDVRCCDRALIAFEDRSEACAYAKIIADRALTQAYVTDRRVTYLRNSRRRARQEVQPIGILLAAAVALTIAPFAALTAVAYAVQQRCHRDGSTFKSSTSDDDVDGLTLTEVDLDKFARRCALNAVALYVVHANGSCSVLHPAKDPSDEFVAHLDSFVWYF